MPSVGLHVTVSWHTNYKEPCKQTVVPILRSSCVFDAVVALSDDRLIVGTAGRLQYYVDVSSSSMMSHNY